MQSDPAKNQKLVLGGLDSLAVLPNLAPSDYYLFRSLQHFLSSKNFENPEAIRNKVSAYFNAKDSSWFEKGFKDLLKRWEIVIDNNDEYIID